MKKIIYLLSILGILIVIAINACEQSDIVQDNIENNAKFVERRGGNGNGRGNNGGGGTTITPDSILNACGIVLTDTGQWYPTVTINNLRSRHQTAYSYDPATGANTYPYDVLVIDFDSVTIPGKTVNCYLLLADQCQSRIVCNKMNGLYMSQVTTCNPTTRFWLPIGTTWLNPNVQSYTGYIFVGTTDGCIFLSQSFSFEPPRILQF